MWFLDWLANIFTDISNSFYSAYLRVYDIPLLGNTIGDFLYRASWFFYDAASATYHLSSWADDVYWKLRDILSWDAILDRLRLYFPWLGDPERHFWQYVYDRLRALFPWLGDPERHFWQYVYDRLRIIFPWLGDPEAHFWQYVYDRLRALFPWLGDPERTMWDYVKNRLDDWFFSFMDRAADKLIDKASNILERLW